MQHLIDVMYKPLPTIDEPLGELEDLLRREQDDKIKRRFHLLVLIKSGAAESRTEAAEHLAVHRHTVGNWLALYSKNGLEGLRKVGTPGPEPGRTSIPPEAMKALSERLDSPEGFASYKAVQRWLCEDFGLDLPYSTVHQIVRYRMGAKPKAPRPSHAKKSRRK
jgi:transposase